MSEVSKDGASIEEIKHSLLAQRIDKLTSKSQYFFVIRELTAREIKRKYARSYLGILWSVLNPLLTMIIMTLIFSTMFKRNIVNFPLYYLTGSLFWSLFSTGTNHAMTGFVDNKTLLLKSKIPKEVFLLSRLYTALINFILSLIPYMAIFMFFRVKLTWMALLAILDLLIFLVFCIGVSFLLATLYVFFADIQYLYSVALTMLMYLSAIFYPAERLPEFMRVVISFNPVYLAIDIARYSVVYGLLPYYTEWIKLIIWAIGTFGLGWLVFQKNENKMMQVI